MIISATKWIERAKFLLLFLLFTLLLYHALDAISAWIAPKSKYKEPDGGAVKVFHYAELDAGQSSRTMAERLKLFYWYGE